MRPEICVHRIGTLSDSKLATDGRMSRTLIFACRCRLDAAALLRVEGHVRHLNTNSSPGANSPIPVSPDNPVRFCAVGSLPNFAMSMGMTSRCEKLTGAIEAASGETGLNERIAGGKVYLVALIANGLNPLRVFKSWWSGANLDELRNGPLDKSMASDHVFSASTVRSMSPGDRAPSQPSVRTTPTRTAAPNAG